MKIKDMKELINLIDRIPPGLDEKRVYLEKPEPFLKFTTNAIEKRVLLDEFDVLQPWAIAALAALGREQEGPRIIIENEHNTAAAKFASAMGIDEIIGNRTQVVAKQKERTVRLRRVNTFEEVEYVSTRIADLVIPMEDNADFEQYIDAEEVRKTIRHVMLELLRNAVQHSQDKQGALILAQRMNKYEHPAIQIVVVDCGYGIYETIRGTHSNIKSPAVALERSILPGYSGTFHEHQRGSTWNAGVGLFFVSEMAKLSAGRLLIASRGASMFIQGDPEGLGKNKIDLLNADFPGTLVAFEIPKRGVGDYTELQKKIHMLARERTAQRLEQHWMRFDVPPPKSSEFMIDIASENTIQAAEFATTQLVPRIKNNEVLVLNFINMKICTQSYMHALLFEPIRIAHELKVPIFGKGATDTVTDGIHYLESYAL